MPTVTDILIESRDDLPTPMKKHDKVDGLVLLKNKYYIPFGKDIPSDGREGDSFAIWSWDGDEDDPTLEPSINLEDFHGHIRNGKFVPVDSN